MALPEPATAAGAAGLAALLADPARALVAVDFDGTLAPIVARPEDSRPAPGAVAALGALAARVGTCAVLSGRAAATVVQLGGLAAVPRLVVLGHYGLQRWADGRLSGPDPEPGVALARARLPDVLTGAPAGVSVEDKSHSLVVHTRPAADPAGALEALVEPLRRLAGEARLELVPGRFVLELRPPGVDKGAALLGLARELDARAVLFAGDDIGDLPAFAAVRSLRAQGCPGLAVCSDDASAEAPAELRAQADLVLDGPTAVVGLLAGLAAAIGDVP